MSNSHPNLEGFGHVRLLSLALCPKIILFRAAQIIAYTETPTPYGSNYGPVEKVEAIDKYTVKVVYKEPYAPALESWGMGIIPKHLLEGKDINN